MRTIKTSFIFLSFAGALALASGNSSAAAQGSSPNSASQAGGAIRIAVPSTPNSLPKATPKSVGSIEVLPDTLGLDFRYYLNVRVFHVIRKNWYASIPQSKRWKHGETVIEFAIMRDGEVADIKVITSSGDAALDQAALVGITASSPFAPLPDSFAGERLSLRTPFIYSPNKSRPAPASSPPLAAPDRP